MVEKKIEVKISFGDGERIANKELDGIKEEFMAVLKRRLSGRNISYGITLEYDEAEIMECVDALIAGSKNG